MQPEDLNIDRIGILGPGRLGTAFAYKFARDGKRVTLYHPDGDICRDINRERQNPRHLTEDLGRLLGGMDRVPRLGSRVAATNDLQRVVDENDFLLLSVTMQRLPDLLYDLKPCLERKGGATCLVSPIKGLLSDTMCRDLITPSRLIRQSLTGLEPLYRAVCIGGPFFERDIALGRPVCVTVAGPRRMSRRFRDAFIAADRRELCAYYNCDAVGTELCGALKNIVANMKGLTDSLELGDSMSGTLFARAGVEIRAISRILGGSFQTFFSQAGVGDMYVTVSSEASKNYRYGRLYHELYQGNPVETHRLVLERIDGTPEGPNAIRHVYDYLERKNMYSPLFRCAHALFNAGGDRKGFRSQVIEAIQFDRREREYIGGISRIAYWLFPKAWYRRDRGLLAGWRR